MTARNIPAVKSQDRQQRGSCLTVGCIQREGVIVGDLSPPKNYDRQNDRQQYDRRKITTIGNKRVQAQSSLHKAANHYFYKITIFIYF